MMVRNSRVEIVWQRPFESGAVSVSDRATPGVNVNKAALLGIQKELREEVH
jgi:hypothetical protein